MFTSLKEVFARKKKRIFLMSYKFIVLGNKTATGITCNFDPSSKNHLIFYSPIYFYVSPGDIFQGPNVPKAKDKIYPI